MKRLKVFYIFAAIILLSGMMYSCTEIIYGEEDENGSSSSGGNNNLKKGQFEMVVDAIDRGIDFSVITNGKITIDWGDGIINEFSSNGTKRIYTHQYPNRNLYTVKITTDVITLFDTRTGIEDIWWNVEELRFGNCPELKTIVCWNQMLAELDVSKCTALTMLDITRDEFSSSALNALFNSLPTRKPSDGAVINCSSNPGTYTCDRTIAEKKGWTVY